MVIWEELGAKLLSTMVVQASGYVTPLNTSQLVRHPKHVHPGKGLGADTGHTGGDTSLVWPEKAMVSSKMRMVKVMMQEV